MEFPENTWLRERWEQSAVYCIIELKHCFDEDAERNSRNAESENVLSKLKGTEPGRPN